MGMVPFSQSNESGSPDWGDGAGGGGVCWLGVIVAPGKLSFEGAGPQDVANVASSSRSPAIVNVYGFGYDWLEGFSRQRMKQLDGVAVRVPLWPTLNVPPPVTVPLLAG